MFIFFSFFSLSQCLLYTFFIPRKKKKDRILPLTHSTLFPLYKLLSYFYIPFISSLYHTTLILTDCHRFKIFIAILTISQSHGSPLGSIIVKCRTWNTHLSNTNLGTPIVFVFVLALCTGVTIFVKYYRKNGVSASCLFRYMREKLIVKKNSNLVFPSRTQSEIHVYMYVTRVLVLPYLTSLVLIVSFSRLWVTIKHTVYMYHVI